MQLVVSFVLMTVLGAVVSLPVQALEGAWYVGAGAGISRLTPETDQSTFTLDDDGSTAAGVYLGLDINNWLAAEVAYTNLGEATLSGGETIDYTAISVGGIAYFYGQRDIRYRQQGLSGYVRLGLSSIDNDATIDLSEENNTAVWLGAGVQYPVGSQWGIRGEITSYDGDAQSVMASVYWRSKSDSRTRGTPAARTPAIPTPRDTARSAPTTPAPVSVPKPVVVPEPVLVAPSERIANSECIDPVASEPRDSRGCSLLSGVLQGVDFEPNTARLTRIGQQLLSRLAASLNEYPDLVSELQVHTEIYAEAGRAMQLSRERVLTVARYLASQSVDVKRLRARAFGSEQPRADNDTAGGRRLNNRVFLRVLP